MTHEPPANDFKSIWQNQKTEEPIMPLEQVRDKALRLDRKVQRGVTIFSAALLLHIFAEAVPSLLGIDKHTWWLVLAKLSTFVVQVVYFPYVFAKQREFMTLSLELSSAPGLAFYRKQLESLLDDYPAQLQVAMVTIAVIVYAIVYPILIPVGILGAIWVFYTRKREAAAAKAELQSLLEFQRQHEKTP